MSIFKNQQRQNAAARQAKRDARTPKQQLQALDSRLGKGKGATKERARLAKQNGAAA